MHLKISLTTVQKLLKQKKHFKKNVNELINLNEA